MIVIEKIGRKKYHLLGRLIQYCEHTIKINVFNNNINTLGTILQGRAGFEAATLTNRVRFCQKNIYI